MCNQKKTFRILPIDVFIAFLFISLPAVNQEHAALIAENTAVFYPPHYKAYMQQPSFALLKEPAETGPLPESWKIRVVFDRMPGKTLAYINADEGTDFYGTGEVTGPLQRNGTVRELWNTDNYEYEKYNGLRLYQSHPWVLGVRKDGSAFGVLADNTWKQTVSLSDDILFISDGPAFRVLVIEGKDPAEVLQVLADLTGTMPLPPLWSLGYQQCRWSYYPASRVKEIADTFRLKNIPCDVIWMDIHYMSGYRIFTFSDDYFPDPGELNNYLHSKGFRSVWMIDPGVKKEEGYRVYDSGTRKKVWVKNVNYVDYTGDVWPGPCVFPDFTQSVTREWWSALYSDFMQTGIDGVWNDMNEPAVFNGPGWSMPADNIHLGDDHTPEGTHARYHNVYGMLMVKASREGIQKANPSKRPFLLTRSNFIGGQRYAATWTGDNAATWQHLRMSVPMALNLGLSGQPFNGPDIGGFGGNATPELYSQWIATGVFYPFSRSHTALGTNNQEPWAFGAETEEIARVALQRRYRLLPYFYTLFYEASKTGMPVMRPVFFADLKDETLRKEDQAFLIGGDLLVIPKWAEVPHLPRGNWRTISVAGEDSRSDPYQPELRIREGSIVPLGNVIPSTSDYSLDTLTLLVSLNEQGTASGSLYHDAGDGYGYLEGEYFLVHYAAKQNGDQVIVKVSGRKGKLTIRNSVIFVKMITNQGVFTGSGSGLGLDPAETGSITVGIKQ